MASKVTLKLGLISFPVTVKTAVEVDKSTSLSTLCKGVEGKGHDAVKINQLIKCPHCERTGTYADFPLRGQDNGDGTFKLPDAEHITAAKEIDEDLKNTLTLTTSPVEQVTASTVPGEKFYYLEPGKGSNENYALVAALLRERPNLAFCTIYAIRSAPAMYVLALKGDVICLQMLTRPEDVKAAPVVSTTFAEAMLPLAAQFADTLVQDFDPATFADTRRANLAAVLDAAGSQAGGEAPVTVAPVKPENTLMAQLLAATQTAEVTPINKVRKPRVRKSA